jgi:hypothetical protein
MIEGAVVVDSRGLIHDFDRYKCVQVGLLDLVLIDRVATTGYLHSTFLDAGTVADIHGIHDVG